MITASASERMNSLIERCTTAAADRRPGASSMPTGRSAPRCARSRASSAWPSSMTSPPLRHRHARARAPLGPASASAAAADRHSRGTRWRCRRAGTCGRWRGSPISRIASTESNVPGHAQVDAIGCGLEAARRHHGVLLLQRLRRSAAARCRAWRASCCDISMKTFSSCVAENVDLADVGHAQQLARGCRST